MAYGPAQHQNPPTVHPIAQATAADSETSPETHRDVSVTTSPRVKNALSALRLLVILLTLALLTSFFVVVPVGSRGVLLRLGAVQDTILSEGFHPLLPIVYSVQPMSVQVQSLVQHSEGASRDLQDVNIDLAVGWHVLAHRVNRVYQQLGDGEAIVKKVIEPAIEDGLKAVVASFTAEQLITERPQVKSALVQVLTERLQGFDLVLDGIDLVQLEFSNRFREAVEAKQVAEQDARRAEYEALKAQRLAAAKVYLAEGEAKAQQLLQTGLTPEVLQRQAIEKWNGHLPLVVGNDSLRSLDIKSLLKADRNLNRRAAG